MYLCKRLQLFTPHLEGDKVRLAQRREAPNLSFTRSPCPYRGSNSQHAVPEAGAAVGYAAIHSATVVIPTINVAALIYFYNYYIIQSNN